MTLAPLSVAQRRAIANLRDLAERAGVPFEEVLLALKDRDIEEVFEELENLEGERLDADAHRWRLTQARLAKGRRRAAAAARAQSPAHGWAAEVEGRRSGQSKEAAYQRIERRERLQPGTVKKAVLRLKK